MANGSAALRIVSELPAVPALLHEVHKPAVDSAAGQAFEIMVGAAVADATIMLCKATLEHRQTGVLDHAIKDTVASRIAEVARLQIDHEAGDADFIRTAHETGRRVLRRYFTDHCHDPVEADAAIDMAIDSVFAVVTKVVKDERVFRAAWAN